MARRHLLAAAALCALCAFGSSAASEEAHPLDAAGGLTYAHVLYTRFCLGQGHEAALVAARLALFEHVCLPTVAGQSTTKFSWLVLVDPTLQPRDRAALEALLAGAGGGRFRVVDVGPDPPPDLWLAAIRTALPGLAADYLVATRLDADDGLPAKYLEQLPRDVAGAAPQGRVVFSCYTTSLEWRPSTRLAAGALEPSAEPVCTTPGLSWAVPFRGSLETALSNLKTVKTLRAGEKGTESEHWFVLKRWTGPGHVRTCVQAKGAGVLPLRSRTVTSNGMLHVDAAADVSTHDAAAWHQFRLEDGYGLSTADLTKANAAIAGREAAIAKDQLAARCRPGWTCKPGAKDKLAALGAGREGIPDYAPKWKGEQPCERYVLTQPGAAGDDAAAAPAGPAPLPAGWKEYEERGRKYYHHAKRGKTQWERPSAASTSQQQQRPRGRRARRAAGLTA